MGHRLRVVEFKTEDGQSVCGRRNVIAIAGLKKRVIVQFRCEATWKVYLGIGVVNVRKLFWIWGSGGITTG
jgi:hypothetical protein